MKDNLIVSILIIAFILVFLTGVYAIWNQAPLLGGGDGFIARSCAVSTVAQALVGTTSATILSANSGRAWAKIEQTLTTAGVATSSVFLSFDEGANAVANAGLTLATSTRTSPEFGRNTNFPYTGAVTGIVGNAGGSLLTASTTVQVTQCLY